MGSPGNRIDGRKSLKRGITLLNSLICSLGQAIRRTIHLYSVKSMLLIKSPVVLLLIDICSVDRIRTQNISVFSLLGHLSFKLVSELVAVLTPIRQATWDVVNQKRGKYLKF
jgi:hypothetical protein